MIAVDDLPGRLPSITTSAGATSYLYYADGHLLIRKDPGPVTLYLADEALVLSTATNTVTTSTQELDGTGYLPSETLYDSLGRVRETEAGTTPSRRCTTSGE